MDWASVCGPFWHPQKGEKKGKMSFYKFIHSFKHLSIGHELTAPHPLFISIYQMNHFRPESISTILHKDCPAFSYNFKICVKYKQAGISFEMQVFHRPGVWWNASMSQNLQIICCERWESWMNSSETNGDTVKIFATWKNILGEKVSKDFQGKKNSATIFNHLLTVFDLFYMNLVQIYVMQETKLTRHQMARHCRRVVGNDDLLVSTAKTITTRCNSNHFILNISYYGW